MRKAVAIVNHKSGIVKRLATSKFCVALIKEKAAKKETTLIAADRTPTVLRHNQWLVGDVTNSICSSQRIIYKTINEHGKKMHKK